MQTALILIKLFLFWPALLAQKNCKVAAGCRSYVNFQIYKTHIKPIKPQKPALIKPVKPTRLGFMIKPGFYTNPEFNQATSLAPAENQTLVYQSSESEENYVPQTANGVGKHVFCPLLCHNDTGWNPSIISRESCINTILVKLWKYKVLRLPWI